MKEKICLCEDRASASETLISMLAQ